jgi:hypothetical protein
VNTNYLNIKLSHKVYRVIRTERRFYDISESHCNNGYILDAVPVPTSTVADLFAQAEKLRQKQQKARGKASRIRRLRKEEAI